MFTWLILGSILSYGFFSEETGIRRVHAHILIDDPASALSEAEALSEVYPNSFEVKKMVVEALSVNGKTQPALDLFNELSFKKPDLLYDRHLLEEIAWGVLKKGIASTQYGVRLSAMIGTFFTNDARAVSLLLKMMRDSNAVIRSIAIQMASTFRDAPLQDEIERLIEEERVWLVRLELIKAVGALKMTHLTEKLNQIIQSSQTSLEERSLAISSILKMYETISLDELTSLATSDRAGLRHLACCIVSHFALEKAERLMEKLIDDPHPSVRIEALGIFARLYRHEKIDLSRVLKDPDPAVAITAVWTAFLKDPVKGRADMKKWLFDPLAENRRLAAAALASTGSKGVDLSLEVFKESKDQYVLANVAIGLLGQRVEVLKCSDLIYRFLTEEKRLVMLDRETNPLFEVLSPSRVRYLDQIPNYPEAENQMARLGLVSLLALVEDERAMPALKDFLKRKHWGVSGYAAATLLHEGDESSLEVVKHLLDDPEPNIRLQACLVLAMFGKDESVLRELQGAYATADHEKKLHILEAIGKIGNTDSFSFLLGVLREPFPILRIAAAAALIQSVNR